MVYGKSKLTSRLFILIILKPLQSMIKKNATGNIVSNSRSYSIYLSLVRVIIKAY